MYKYQKPMLMFAVMCYLWIKLQELSFNEFMIYCELEVRVGSRELDAIFTEMCSLYKYMSHNRAIMIAQT